MLYQKIYCIIITLYIFYDGGEKMSSKNQQKKSSSKKPVKKQGYFTQKDGVFQKKLLPILAAVLFVATFATGLWHRDVYLKWIVNQYYISLILMFVEFGLMGLLLWLSKPQFTKNARGFIISCALGAASFVPFELFMVIINVIIFKQAAPSEAVHIGLAYGLIMGTIILIYTLCRKLHLSVKASVISVAGSIIAAIPLGIFFKRTVPILLAAIVAFGQNVMHKAVIVESLDEGWCINNNGYASSGAQVDRLIAVVPSEAHIAHSKLGYYNFVHFGVNTFNDVEWGNGKETVDMFAPKTVDTDQWCRVFKESGSKGVIFTVKHHDGFCLWDTKTTDFNVMNSPYGKDVLKQLELSCKKYGLKLGIYLSPWDMHEDSYGSGKAYDDFFVAQITELLTNYGDIFEFWFDGAFDKSITPTAQNYDWQRYYDTIHSLQPGILIACAGPDIRWNGSEFGPWRESGEWSVYPTSNISVSTGESLAGVDEVSEDTGSREVVKDLGEFKWYPAESNMSIASGWFYHDYGPSADLNIGVKSSEQIAESYLGAVGGNASFLLNVGPNKDGVISERDCKTLQGFKEIVDDVFANRIEGIKAGAVNKAGETKSSEEYSALLSEQTSYKLKDDEYAVSLKLPEQKKVTALVISEDIAYSQRVEEFKVYAKTADGYELLSENKVIGSKCIIQFDYPVSSDEIIIAITQSRSNPVIKGISLYE